MSLGGIAIAIGAMIDAAIVMLENLHQHIEHQPDRPHWERVFEAAREVGPALFMSLLVITLSFLAVLTLEGPGASVMKRIAAPMVGGMATLTVLTLVVIPVIY